MVMKKFHKYLLRPWPIPKQWTRTLQRTSCYYNYALTVKCRLNNCLINQSGQWVTQPYLTETNTAQKFKFRVE